jgi:uncharacterized protein YaaN involved in tellurite resistance|tara:strand:+ start:94 stop:354 length:261 start_codon:yes stop_codon:yes gene_type:complete
VILKGIVTTIFKSVFKDKIDEFEKRLTKIESKIDLINEKITDNKSEIKETNKDVSLLNNSTIRVESIVETMRYLSKPKTMSDGTDE